MSQKFKVGESFTKPKPRDPKLVKALQTKVEIPTACTNHLRIPTQQK